MTETKAPKINKTVIKKLLKVVDAGLSNGLGHPEPGSMCVEAAVCYALGLPHGDDPGCVAPAIRAFKIALNDSEWSSNEARAKGLRELAILQLGTKDNFDEREFAKRLSISLLNNIISDLPGLPEELRKACKEANTLASAGYAAKSAEYAESAEYAKYAGYAAKYAGYAAKSAEYAAEYAKYAGYAAGYAGYAAKSAEYAAEYAGYAAKFAGYAVSDKVLFKMAKIAAVILIDMDVPGVKYLDLL